MAEIPERIKEAERLEMDEMRKGKSHEDAEQEERKFLRKQPRGLDRGGARR